MKIINTKYIYVLLCAVLCYACIHLSILKKNVSSIETSKCAFIRRAVASRTFSKLGIPKILHQTWSTKQVPRDLEKWIKSWWIINPEWEYWFWTDDAVRCLLKEHYPQNLNMFNKYPKGIFRGDAMRYFVLYHFGGIYADLDVEALQPMDELLDNYSCLLSYENYEHAYFLYNLDVPFVMNVIMACRPHHPFFSTLINALQSYSHIKSVYYATGPVFVTEVFSIYNRTMEDTPHKGPISVLHPKYLLPTFDKGKIRRFKSKCSNNQNRDRKVLCDWQIKDHWRNMPHNVSYTNHHWYHVIDKRKSRKWPGSNVFDIRLMMTNLISFKPNS